LVAVLVFTVWGCPPKTRSGSATFEFRFVHRIDGGVFNYSASAYAGAGLRSRPSRSVPCSRQCHYLPLTSRCSTRPMAAGRPFHCGFASIARAPLSFALADHMQITDELKKIDRASATAIATLFLSLLGPGLLVIFNFDRDLYTSLDTVKLVLLAISLAAPGVFIPYTVTSIAISILEHKSTITKGQLGSPTIWFHKHGFNNSVNMYLSLFICYAFSLSFTWFAYFFAFTIIFSSIFEIFHIVKLSRNPEKYIPITSHDC